MNGGLDNPSLCQSPSPVCDLELNGDGPAVRMLGEEVNPAPQVTDVTPAGVSLAGQPSRDGRMQCCLRDWLRKPTLKSTTSCRRR